LGLIDKAIEAKIPKPAAVLGDAGFGNSSSFRLGLRERHLHYGVGVQGSTLVQRVDEAEIRRGPAVSIESLAQKADYRKYSWREGTKGKMSSRFAFYRVVPQREKDEGFEKETLWLVLERPSDETERPKYSLCSLPKTTSKTRLIRILHQRWRTERVYEDMKNELGLDHYEGRSFIGWHHHVTAVMVAYAFIAAEQARLFPPGHTQEGNREWIYCNINAINVALRAFACAPMPGSV
jgi:SRSO17 transposase